MENNGKQTYAYRVRRTTFSGICANFKGWNRSDFEDATIHFGNGSASRYM